MTGAITNFTKFWVDVPQAIVLSYCWFLECPK